MLQELLAFSDGPVLYPGWCILRTPYGCHHPTESIAKLYSHFLYKFVNFHTRPLRTDRGNQKQICQDPILIYTMICAVCFAAWGTAGVNENQPLGHECIAVSSSLWRTASFCVQRAAEVQPWLSWEWSSSFTGTVSQLGVACQRRRCCSVQVQWPVSEIRTETSHLWQQPDSLQQLFWNFQKVWTLWFMKEKLAHWLCQPRVLKSPAPQRTCTGQSLEFHAAFWACESTFLFHTLCIAKNIPLRKAQCHLIDLKSLKMFRKNRCEREYVDLMHSFLWSKNHLLSICFILRSVGVVG